MKRALGIAALAAVLLAAPSASAQFFSPGSLSRAHSSLEGLEKCSKCHEAQKGLSARLCLDCHTELQARIVKNAGFHGHLAPAKRQECQGCHPDHRGLDFAMVDWEGGRDKFDHQKTGWVLKGAHTKARCNDCHQPRLIADASIRRLLEKGPKRTTFLGESTRCDSCHFDEHRGQLSRECQKCHNETAWKPPTSFNHQNAAFHLLGKHRGVACAKCHPSDVDEAFVATAFPKPRSASFMQMKPIDFKTCESCHNDPHKGSLGPNCAGCHTEDGWKLIKNNQDTAFHDNTKFPLRGEHIGVACRSCHGPFPGQPARFKGLAFAHCADCHEDSHMGQLRPKPPAKVVACEGCHTVNEFVPARFELEQHQATKFPLDGAHAAVACRGCHPIDPGLAARIPVAVRVRLHAHKRPEQFSFALLHPKKTPLACNGCHDDVHRGQFTEATLGRKGESLRIVENAGGHAEGARERDVCAICHQTTSFADLTFNHNKDSRFPLTGKHATTACSSCHRPQRTAGGPAVVRYKPLDVACGSCHADYHQGQFLVAAVARTSSSSSAMSGMSSDSSDPVQPRPARGCDACHKTTRFKDTIFEHNNPAFTSYPLEGRHTTVACAKCHPTVKVAPEVETARYRPMPHFCEECHVDFHHGQFRGFEP